MTANGECNDPDCRFAHSPAEIRKINLHRVGRGQKGEAKTRGRAKQTVPARDIAPPPQPQNTRDLEPRFVAIGQDSTVEDLPLPERLWCPRNPIASECRPSTSASTLESEVGNVWNDDLDFNIPRFQHSGFADTGRDFAGRDFAGRDFASREFASRDFAGRGFQHELFPHSNKGISPGSSYMGFERPQSDGRDDTGLTLVVKNTFLQLESEAKRGMIPSLYSAPIL